MCRLLGYLGPTIQLDRLLSKPEHSLIVQSYQPQEMTSGLLNADGFGVGWYHTQQLVPPFTYKNTLPIWNDMNLPNLSRYIESNCILANVRSATPGLPIDMSNCQPFQQDQILGMHNGFIENFRKTLYRPIRDRLSDKAYAAISGLTDSEHIFAMIVDALELEPQLSLQQALHKALLTLRDLAKQHETDFSANLLVSDGQQMVASRVSTRSPTPTLYWLRDDPTFPDAVIVASEPLFPGNWISCPESSILMVADDLNVQICPI